jgi:CheY-like chemotaxis protein
LEVSGPIKDERHAGTDQVPKLLIIDDDEAMRGLLRTRLLGAYETIATGDPEQALGLALEHKPDAILLDLMMPKFSGFELCQRLRSLSYTSMIPIFVISGEDGTKYRQYCKNLGATAYFQKPLDFAALRTALDGAIQGKQAERRAHVRVRMRVALKLRGTDIAGKRFEEKVFTENVSAGGFLCQCKALLFEGAAVEVFLVGEQERYAGLAQVVRHDTPDPSERWFGFQFKEMTTEWVLQPN